MNNVSLVGRLTKDVELRYTQAGVAAASFTLAVTRNFKNNNGENESDFIRCQIWRKPAESFANFTGKGALVSIEGQIRTGSYEGQDGKRVYTTDVVVSNFGLLETKAESERRRANNGASDDVFNNNQGNYTNQGQNAYNGPKNGYNQQQQNQGKQQVAQQGSFNPWDENEGVNINPDDLPF